MSGGKTTESFAVVLNSESTLEFGEGEEEESIEANLEFSEEVLCAPDKEEEPESELDRKDHELNAPYFEEESDKTSDMGEEN